MFLLASIKAPNITRTVFKTFLTPSIYPDFCASSSWLVSVHSDDYRKLWLRIGEGGKWEHGRADDLVITITGHGFPVLNNRRGEWGEVKVTLQRKLIKKKKKLPLEKASSEASYKRCKIQCSFFQMARLTSNDHSMHKWNGRSDIFILFIFKLDASHFLHKWLQLQGKCTL